MSNSDTEMSKKEMLFRLLKKEAQYYNAILDLVKEEAFKLGNESTCNEVLPLIKKREILFSCIQEIEKALTPLKNDWKKDSNSLDPFTTQVKQQLLENDLILEQILKQDQENQKSMKKYLQNLKSTKN
ncbi:MAG: hypothetical protein CMO81_05295 [Waddliaceae bacterium]|nr:hypothetical protein [Waddliaceae bacterium]